jgi:hypothetical protein
MAAPALAWPLTAQGQQVPSAASPSPDPGSIASFGSAPLLGRWVRMDGGYVIAIKAVDVNGNRDANYANLGVLPFYTTVASSDGGVLKLFLIYVPVDMVARPIR